MVGRELVEVPGKLVTQKGVRWKKVALTPGMCAAGHRIRPLKCATQQKLNSAVLPGSKSSGNHTIEGCAQLVNLYFCFKIVFTFQFVSLHFLQPLI